MSSEMHPLGCSSNEVPFTAGSTGGGVPYRSSALALSSLHV